MSITGLTVTLDRDYYSRFETGKTNRSRITATIKVEGSGDDVQVKLLKQTPIGQREIASTTAVAVNVASYPAVFNLSNLFTAEGFTAALLSRSLNDYSVVASVVGHPEITAEATCTVLLVTPDEMRHRWCFGLPLFSSEVSMPRFQPQQVTGVTVLAAGYQTALGPGALVWNATTHQLTWRGGLASVALTEDGTYTLLDPTSLGYLTVQVDVSALPATSVTETLVIDRAPITDEDIAKYILAAMDKVERGIDVRLEPMHLVTKKFADQVADYDEVIEGLAWYRPVDNARWLSLRMIPSLHKVYALQGWTNESKVVDMPQGWIVISAEITGFVELIPSNIAIVQWYYYGPWMPGLLEAAGHIAQFWQFDILAGLRKIPPALIEFIAKMAAIEILTIAGHARYPGGIAGMSLGRDGVSESTSLMPGIYRATIDRYLDDTGQGQNPRTWTMQSWKEHLVGFAMVVL